MQTSIIVQAGQGSGHSKLEEHLEMGWKVIQMCPMPSSVGGGGESGFTKDHPPSCLVILEKQTLL
jgi:hypothetical protein